MRNIPVIGIIGGVGSGKSTVCSLLCEQFEICRIDTDGIARDQMRRGGVTYEPVLEAFGTGILGKDGEIDRKLLAAMVFSDENKRRRLNALTHPRVMETVLERLAELRQTGEYQAAAIETALPAEADCVRFCDMIWYVYASKTERVQRLMKNRSYTHARIEAMFARQCDAEGYLACATHVILNRDGVTAAQLTARLHEIMEKVGLTSR